MLLRSFSLLGLRSDADFMLWRIGHDLGAFEAMTSSGRCTPRNSIAVRSAVAACRLHPLVPAESPPLGEGAKTKG